MRSPPGPPGSEDPGATSSASPRSEDPGATSSEHWGATSSPALWREGLQPLAKEGGSRVSFAARPHQREQDDVANRGAVGQQHDETVDANSFTGRGRQAVFEGPDVVVVHCVRLLIPGGAVRQLCLEPPPLLRRVVELAEGIGHLEPSDIELEALDRVRIVRLLL